MESKVTWVMDIHNGAGMGNYRNGANGANGDVLSIENPNGRS